MFCRLMGYGARDRARRLDHLWIVRATVEANCCQTAFARGKRSNVNVARV